MKTETLRFIDGNEKIQYIYFDVDNLELVDSMEVLWDRYMNNPRHHQMCFPDAGGQVLMAFSSSLASEKELRRLLMGMYADHISGKRVQIDINC